jgi:hypothetical protein
LERSFLPQEVRRAARQRIGSALSQYFINLR